MISSGSYLRPIAIVGWDPAERLAFSRSTGPPWTPYLMQDGLEVRAQKPLQPGQFWAAINRRILLLDYVHRVGENIDAPDLTNL